MAWKRPSVLVVEDDLEMRSLLFEELWSEGYQMWEARNGTEALALVSQSPPDLIITDLRMPHGGLDYVQRLHAQVPHCPILVMTAFGDEKAKREVLAAGARAYFSKPVHLSQLKLHARQLLDASLQVLKSVT